MSAARDVHVGAPKADFDFPLEDSVNVHYHDFVNLGSSGENNFVTSPIFTCAGYEWTLVLFPGGTGLSKRGMMGILLLSLSHSHVTMGYEISIIKKNGSIYQRMTDADDTVSLSDFNSELDNQTWGFFDFANRGNVLDPSNNIINNGMLTVNVRIRPHADFHCQTIQPQPSLGQNIYKLFLDKETADVGFIVGGEIVYAHQFVLKVQAPHFAELTEHFDKDNHMTIDDVDHKSFQLILCHVYGRQILADQWREHSKQILEASVKYGFTALKFEAEAWHTKVHNFTVDNAVDELLYADAKNCPRLKKAAMKFIVDNGNDIIASTSYDRLDESPRLRKEVMQEFAKSNESKKRKRDE